MIRFIDGQWYLIDPEKGKRSVTDGMVDAYIGHLEKALAQAKDAIVLQKLDRIVGLLEILVTQDMSDESKAILLQEMRK